MGCVNGCANYLKSYADGREAARGIAPSGSSLR